MKKSLKRVISGLLAFSMIFSLTAQQGAVARADDTEPEVQETGLEIGMSEMEPVILRNDTGSDITFISLSEREDSEDIQNALKEEEVIRSEESVKFYHDFIEDTEYVLTVKCNGKTYTINMLEYFSTDLTKEVSVRLDETYDFMYLVGTAFDGQSFSTYEDELAFMSEDKEDKTEETAEEITEETEVRTEGSTETLEEKKEEKEELIEIEASDLPYRILVATDDADILTDGYIISGYDGIYLVGYRTEEERNEGYSFYQDKADFAEYDDDIFEVAEDISTETDASEMEVVNSEDALTLLGELDESEVAGAPKVIAVIDTGVDESVADAVSVIGESVKDDNGHGTAVIDAIMAENPKAKILSIKAFDENGKAKPSDIYAAVRYAIDNNVSMINMSFSALSREENSIVNDVIDEAVESGITVVGAAGNYGKDAKFFIPGNIVEAYVIGACDDKGVKQAESNYGDTVDYYVCAESTSLASARFTGILSGSSLIRITDMLGKGVIFMGDALEVVENKSSEKDDEGFDVQAYSGSGDGQQYLTYIGERYVSWSEEVYRSSFGVATRKFFIIDGDSWTGQNWNAYCVDPSLDKPAKGKYKVYEVGEYIGKVMYYMYGAPGWDTSLECLGNKSLHQYVDEKGYTSEGGHVTVCHYIMATLAQTQQLGGTGYSNSPTWVQGLATVLINGASYPPLGFHCYFAFSYEKNHSWQNVWGWSYREPYYVTLEKSSSVSGYGKSLDGVQYGLYKNNDSKDKDRHIATFTLDANGKTKDISFPSTSDKSGIDGKYVKDGRTWLVWDSSYDTQKWYFKELKTNGNYAMDVIGHDITVKRGENILKTQDYPAYGMVQVYKTDEKGNPLEGCTFGIYDSKAKADAGTINNKNTTLSIDTTKSTGLVSFTDLPNGDYYVKELSAPDGYIADSKTYGPLKVDVNENNTFFNNGQYYGYVFNSAEYISTAYNAGQDLRKAFGTDTVKLSNHFLSAGMNEGRRASVNFSLSDYKAANPGLVTVFGSNNKLYYTHYQNFGAKEGRLARPVSEYQKMSYGINQNNTAVVVLKMKNDKQEKYIYLEKRSSNPDCVKDNPNYSLAGTKFKVFKDEPSANLALISKDYSASIGELSITADKIGADGIGRSNLLDVSDYMQKNERTGKIRSTTFFAIETEAGKGYEKSTKVHRVIVSPDNDKNNPAKIEAENTPQFDPVQIKVYKVNFDGDNNPDGNGSLENAEFTIKYYSVDVNRTYSAIQLGELKADATWTIKTKYDDVNHINIAAFGAGWLTGENNSPFYAVFGGMGELPAGYITIQETKAPTGYTADNAVFKAQRTGEKLSAENGIIVASTKDMQNLTVGNTAIDGGIIIEERPIRGDFELVKVDEDGHPMSDVEFEIKSVTTGETKTIKTGKDGKYNSKDILWFGMKKDGSETEKTDGLGALPTGTYTVTEKRCEANKGYQLQPPITFTVSEAVTYTVKDGKVTENSITNVKNPVITTSASVIETGLKIAPADSVVTVKDTVTYRNLKADTEYTAVGSLMVVNEDGTSEAYKVNGKDYTVTKTFKTGAAYTKSIYEAKGSFEVEFKVDTKGLDGKKLVVFERVNLADGNEQYEGTDEKIFPILHENLEDENQTIIIPDGHTSAKDAATGDHITFASEEAEIIDTVTYKGLIPDKEYTVTGYLMDKEKNELLLDKDGKRIESTEKFIPEKEDGSVEVSFRFDTSLLKGRKIVVFEDVLFGDKPVFIHHDIEDSEQTVIIPEGHTVLLDDKTHEHLTLAEEEASVTDTVYYEGLLAGKTYTATGVLYDRAIGEPIKDAEGKEITNTVTFIPDASDGFIQVPFSFDAFYLKGKSIVAFEDICLDGKQVVIHHDINDIEQTTWIPDGHTTALDEKTGDHMTLAEEEAHIDDTVSYKNLIADGREYTVKGTLMDKATGEAVKGKDGRDITNTVTFIPETPDGEVVVPFSFDSSLLEGQKIVVFEDVTYGGKEVFIHHDLDYANQMTSIPKGHTEAKDVKTFTGMALAEEETTIYDFVFYEGLITDGREYEVKGVLMDRDTEKPLLGADCKEITNTVKFVPETEKGYITVPFSFDSSLLRGKTAVVFEDVIYDGKTVFMHHDITDRKQTVVFPEVVTTATIKNAGKTVTAGDDVTIVDEVEVTNILAGEEYIVKGRLMDRSTGKPFMIDGKELTAEKSFKAEVEKMTVTTEFAFSTKGIDKISLVVYEELYVVREINGERKEVKVASHCNLADEKQTVNLITVPKTGDSVPLIPIAGTGAGALIGMGIVIGKKKKRKEAGK